ncbi:hypothetical protein N3K66_008397 [Trichothecium roseum]|uniref:Uncharacterized protein n=1 Tax=Trichothecium roseum TaxID=47278 RepID=A0ACC0UQ34_9HYPO|nr:hypothetical protein N3K66_008397 [Trichothecium roseum]
MASTENQLDTNDNGSSNVNNLPPLPPAYLRALHLIDEAHRQDPNLVDGPAGPGTLPYEAHYAQQMTRWLGERSPRASPALQLACRAQHFRRWELPRSSFPMTRPGYLTWRSKQKSQAASQVASLLSSPPPASSSHAKAAAVEEEEAETIPQPDIDRIAALIRKENLAADPEAQALEDVACLVFLDGQLDAFERRDDVGEDKMVAILRKTWAKMGAEGRAIALRMDLSDRARTLVGKALEG